MQKESRNFDAKTALRKPILATVTVNLQNCIQGSGILLSSWNSTVLLSGITLKFSCLCIQRRERHPWASEDSHHRQKLLL